MALFLFYYKNMSKKLSLNLVIKIQNRLKNFIDDRKKDIFSDKGIVTFIGDGIANAHGLESVQKPEERKDD